MHIFPPSEVRTHVQDQASKLSIPPEFSITKAVIPQLSPESTKSDRGRSKSPPCLRKSPETRTGHPIHPFPTHRIVINAQASQYFPSVPLLGFPFKHIFADCRP